MIGIPKGLAVAEHSTINCLYLGSNICRFRSSPGNTTMPKGNIGIKFVISILIILIYCLATLGLKIYRVKKKFVL